MTHAGSNVIAAHGISEQANFQINANAQAFRILSSGLYSDKVAAVLREIGCNAADAHVAAQTPERPIEVKLPTALDPAFYIKDWGPGLSHDQIKGLFTTYFSSNKSHSNEMTGAFGLGSKSPFSYTDSFSITSVHEGVQRAYTAHLGADGSPVISLLGQGAAQGEWMTGVMVSFPVKPKDVPEFHLKARAVFQWFKVKPRLLGAEPIVEPVFGLVGSNFRMDSAKVEFAAARVLMGNVAYPLDPDQLAAPDPMVIAVIKSGLHLQVPIGSVMPTASREYLDYNPQTRTYLSQAIREVAREIGQTVWALAEEAAGHGWAGRQRLHAYVTAIPFTIRQYHLEHMLQMVPGHDSQARKTISERVGANHCTLPTWVGDSTCRVHLYRSGTRERTISRREVIGGHVEGRTGSEHAILLYEESPRVIVVDAPHCEARIRQLLREKENVAVLSVSAKAGVPASTLSAYAAKLSGELGDLPLEMGSSLKAPALKSKQSAGSTAGVAPEVLHATKVVTYHDLTTGQYSANRVRYELGSIPEAGRFYVAKNEGGRSYTVHFGKSSRTHCEDSLDRMFSAYRRLRALGLPLTEINGVVEVTAGQLQSLGLRGSHWKNAFLAMCSALQSEACLEAFPRCVSALPRLHLPTSRATPLSAGLTGVLSLARHHGGPLWDALRPVVSEHPQLLALIKEVQEADLPHADRVKARDAFDEFRRAWAVSLGKVETMIYLERDLPQHLAKLHPLTLFVDGEAFWNAGNADPRGAAQMLQALLLSRGRARSKSPAASDAQLTLDIAV